MTLNRAAAAEPFRRDVSRTRALLRRALEDFAAAAAKMDLRGAGRLAKEVRSSARELAPALVMVESITAAPPAGGEWADVARAAQIDADLRRIRSQASVEICLTAAPGFPEASQLVQAVIDQISALGVTALPCGKSSATALFRAEGRISAVFSPRRCSMELCSVARAWTFGCLTCAAAPRSCRLGLVAIPRGPLGETERPPLALR